MHKKLLLEKNKLAMIALGLTISLTFAACTPAQKPTVSAPPATTEVPPQTPASQEGAESAVPDLNAVLPASESGQTGMVDPETGVRTVTVEAGSFYYKPDVIRVKKGEKVKLVLNSVDIMHNFNVDELKIKVPVTKSGSTSTVEFTATTAGSFEYYCSVGQHRANGQVGTLIVE